VATGADLVCFSGDKLLGGPQAGLLIGRAEVVEAIRTNPLARALRLDKLGIAALGATLSALLDDRLQDIPVLQQLLMPLAEIESRARALAKACEERVGGALEVTVEPQTAPVGGGSLPGFALETRVVALSGRKATQLAESLRRAPTPVIARLQDQALLLDPRTLLEGDTEALLEALETALGPRDRPRWLQAPVNHAEFECAGPESFVLADPRDLGETGLLARVFRDRQCGGRAIPDVRLRQLGREARRGVR
jgi:L-seryl-tRNA(Ser) seleniumtransferase